MSITETIKSQMKEAMKAKDSNRVTTLRSLMAAFTNELVAQKKMPQDILPDADALSVIKRLAKQRKDAIQQFTDGDRADLAEDEKKELVIIEEFLPEMMSTADIKPIAEKVLEEMGISEKSDMGKAIGAVMQKTGGEADGNDVKQVIMDLLS